jgi:hypothetical protein
MSGSTTSNPVAAGSIFEGLTAGKQSGRKTRRPSIRTASAVLVLLLGAADSAVAGSYTYTTIDYGQGTPGTYVSGVNAAGVVTGFYEGGDGYTHGFTWSAGAFTSFDATSAAGSTLPAAINERGQVVETFIPSRGEQRQAFLRERGGVQHKLPFPDSESVQATGINKHGAIVGTITDAASTNGFLLVGQVVTKLVVPGATMTTADAINESGIVAGSFTDSTGPGGYTYVAGAYHSFRTPHLDSLEVSAIDRAGLVAGSYLHVSDHGLVAQERGFTFGSDGFHGFNPVWSLNTFLSAAFAPGHYVGTMQKPENFEGFVFSHGHGIAILPPGAGGGSVVGGTASGLVVGNFNDSSNVNHGFIALCLAEQAPCTD